MIIRAKAPLRISFAGGGTDVPPFPEREGGLVLNATIGKYAYGSLREREDDLIMIESLDLGKSFQWKIGDVLKLDGNFDLVKTAIRKFDRGGFDLLLNSDAPPGSGLGSSSALMVVLVGLLTELKGLHLDSYEIAAVAHEIERVEVGIPGGLQDHYASAFGGFNFIEFDKNRVVVNPLRISRDIVNELEHNLILCFTEQAEGHSGIIDDQMGRYIRGEYDVRDALLEQKQLAMEMKYTLLRGNLDEFGLLMNLAWVSKKRMSPKVSTPLADALYRTAIDAGALGGKLTGAGGGGYMLFYCSFERRYKVVEALAAYGVLPTSFSFDEHGLQTWRKQIPVEAAL